MDVATLVAWPGNVEGGKVVVLAADADGDHVRWALMPSALELVAASTRALVTGRVAGDRASALAALVGVAPSLEVAGGKRFRGKGPRMMLDFVGASTDDFYRLFGTALRVSVVVLAPPAKVTVRSTMGSADALMAEVARVTDMVIERPAAGVVVVRTAAQPAIGKLPAKGKKLALDTHQARAGDVLALLRALEPGGELRGVTPCTPGAAIDVRLERVANDTVVRLVEIAGGIDENGPPCELVPVTEDDLEDLRLVAVASRGARKLAVGMAGDRAVLIDDATPAWEVGTSWVTFHGATDLSLTLHPSHVDGDAAAIPTDANPLAEFDGARLAATITGLGGPADDRAVIELRGEFRLVSPMVLVDDRVQVGAGVVRIGAGTLELIAPGGATRTLQLEARPP